ncbi:MAG: hypothetical protein HN564_03520, partial [Flavobacteriales bacterium]|nr:hypothetical protein [Flavobacteriales bacterium]
MKKYFVLFLSFVLISSLIEAQNINDYKKNNSTFLNLLPSNANPEDLRPSDIPSTQVLKQMGFSEEEIQEAMDFKFSE